MAWVDEFIGWLSEKFVYDDAGRELDRLSNLLRSEEVEERLAAVRQLTFMKAVDSTELLIAALRDSSPSVRSAAASALGYKAAVQASAPLALLLGDADADVRRMSIRALDAIGSPAAHSWLRFWRDRVVAAASDPRIAEMLGRALSDGDPAVRNEAVAALPRHGARGVGIVRDYFRGVAKDESAQLETARQPLTEALKAREPEHRKAALETLFELYREDSIRALSEALGDSSPEVRKAAVEAVTSLGPRPALDELLARLGDSDEGVVVRVIEGLVCARNLESFSKTEELRIHQELLRLVRYGGGRAQEVAVWAVGEMRRVEAVSALCDLLAGDHSEALLAATCDALGKINDARAITPLLERLEKGAPTNAAVAAIRALTQTGDVRVIPVVVRHAFAETRPEVDRACDEAFSTLCSPAEDGARAELSSDDRATRLAAIRRAISDPRLVFALIAQMLEGDEEIRTAARGALEGQGFDLLALARSALVLADKAESRRILAINLLSSLRPPDAETLFDALLTDANEPVEVYRHAVSALGRAGTESARTILQRHAAHAQESIREAVQRALAPPAPA